MSSPPPRPVPRTDDPDSATFWAAAAEGRLLVALGTDGVPVHPPRRAGAGTPVRWVEASGAAHLHSWTVTRHTVDPAFPGPYTVVLVELDDHPGVRFVGHLSGAPELCAGMAMRVWFDQRGDTVVPNWTPAATERKSG